jgi:hypothetical protein
MPQPLKDFFPKSLRGRGVEFGKDILANLNYATSLRKGTGRKERKEKKKEEIKRERR